MKKILVLISGLLFSMTAFCQTSVTLDGSASFDPDGTIVSYQWTQIAGPSISSITNSTSVKATASNFVVGIYQYQLTVTDNQGATASDTMQLTVNKANTAPKANAGPDQTIQLPGTTTFIDFPKSVKEMAYYTKK
jgi:chitodextrinase